MVTMKGLKQTGHYSVLEEKGARLEGHAGGPGRVPTERQAGSVAEPLGVCGWSASRFLD